MWLPFSLFSRPHIQVRKYWIQIILPLPLRPSCNGPVSGLQDLSVPSDSMLLHGPMPPPPLKSWSTASGSRIKFTLLSLGLRTGNGPSLPVQAHCSSQALPLDLSLCLFPCSHSGSLALPQICFVISHIALFTLTSTPKQLLITVHSICLLSARSRLYI